MTPIIHGASPIPMATPAEIVTPMAIDRSERAVSFEIAAKPTVILLLEAESSIDQEKLARDKIGIV